MILINFRTRNGQLDVHEVPIMIPKLIYLCRKAVNISCHRKQIEKARLPNELKRFLTYQDISDQPKNISPIIMASNTQSKNVMNSSPTSIIQNTTTQYAANFAF